LKENVLKRNNLMLGREEDVMISWIKDWLYFGRTRNFKEVYFSWDENSKIWVIQKVKINNAEWFILKWELVK
jgi:tRNA A37 methylthiotransferase MiaB